MSAQPCKEYTYHPKTRQEVINAMREERHAELKARKEHDAKKARDKAALVEENDQLVTSNDMKGKAEVVELEEMTIGEIGRRNT